MLVALARREVAHDGAIVPQLVRADPLQDFEVLVCVMVSVRGG